jgi:hypothetical protein
MAKASAQSATQTEASKPPKYHPCKCMVGTREKCPEETTRAFARGHDAKMSSRLAAQIATGKMEPAKATSLLKEAGGSDMLVSKTLHSAKLRTDKATEKAKAKAEKASKPKAEKPAAKPVAEAPKDADEDELDEDEDDVEDDDEDDDDEVEDVPALAVGTKGHVPDGDKTYTAVVVRNASGELVARHRLQGKNCDHSLDEFTTS